MGAPDLGGLQYVPNYHLAAIANQETFPLLNVVIVDAHYAAIFEPLSQTSDSPYIFIEDAKTAEALRKYFESLWNVATKVKIAKHLYEDNLLAIGKQLTIGSSGRRSAAAEP